MKKCTIRLPRLVSVETENLVGKNQSELYTKNLVGKNQPVRITYCVL